MNKQKTILVCPLDWGLGHATRCIPIINVFLAESAKVIIATSGQQKALLQKEFTSLPFLDLTGYEVDYPKNESMILKILTQLPKIKKAIDNEHKWLEKIVNEYDIDVVVSDNRYGLWTNKIPCVLVTHQIFIKSPLGESIIEKKAQQYFNNFSQIWIPDVQGNENLSGDLSHKKPLPDKFKFIGVLSRFSNYIVTSSVSPLCGTYREVNDFEYDVMAIISGPEPQRSIFEKLVLEQLDKTKLKAVVLRGLLETNEKLKIENSKIEVFNHLETNEFLYYLQKSKLVISRSGYSTIMDLATLSKKAIFVPTPGQTEQEYLAKYHHEKGHFYAQKQSEFDLEKALKESENFSGIQIDISCNQLEEQIQQLLN